MGQWIAQQHAVPDLILSSTAKRAVSTAEQTAMAMAYEGEICYDQSLYLASPKACLQAIRSHAKAHARVMIVGHNPGLQALIRNLTGVDRALPTAGLADIRLALDAWQDLTSHTTGQLSHFWLPRELFP
jgi:phosphohistidine phosphatase